MTAGEDQPQQVVVHHAFRLDHVQYLLRRVGAFLRGRPGRRRLLHRPGRLVAEHVVGLVPRGDGQPGPRVVRHPGGGPGPECRDGRLLHGVLGELKITEGPDEGRQHAAALIPDRVGQPLLGARKPLLRNHWPAAGPLIGNTGRSSTLPRQAAGICAAHLMASSRSAASIR